MSGTQLEIKQIDGDVVIPVKVVPSASRTRVMGILGGALKIAVSAPPEKNKANLAVLKLLAGELGLARHDIRLIEGRHSPRKTILLAGLDMKDARQRLTALLVKSGT